MTKVSIVVPVYNVEQYLPRCLDNLVQQTLRDIEIICVDDQSPDNSLQILRKYEADYPGLVKVIQSDINRRQGGARNLGIRAAVGEYIGFVDSDDWVETTMFETLYNRAILTGSDVVDCNYYLAFSDHRIVCKSNSQDQAGELTVEKKKTLVTNPGRTWTKIYKRSLFVDYDIYFPEHLIYEDNEIMPLIMVYANRLAKVDDSLYNYFVGTGESTTEKKNDFRQFDRLTTSVNMLNHFIDRGLIKTFKTEIEYRFIKLYYVITIPLCMNRFNPPEKKHLYQIRDYMRQNCKDYRKNPYFIKKESTYTKLITLANDISPILAIMINFVSRKSIKLLPSSIRRKFLSPRSGLLDSNITYS